MDRIIPSENHIIWLILAAYFAIGQIVADRERRKPLGFARLKSELTLTLFWPLHAYGMWREWRETRPGEPHPLSLRDLPAPFLQALEGRLGSEDVNHLDRLLKRLDVFKQKIFFTSAFLGDDGGFPMFSGFLTSVANRLMQVRDKLDEESEFLLGVATELNPERSIAPASLAIGYQASGRYDLAKRYAEKGLAALTTHDADLVRLAERFGAEFVVERLQLGGDESAVRAAELTETLTAILRG